MKKIISEMKEVSRIAIVFLIIIAFVNLLIWLINQIN